MQRLLRRACHATNLAREQGMALSPQFIAMIERCYDAVLTEGARVPADAATRLDLHREETHGPETAPGLAIIFCVVSMPANTTCCASCPIQPCRHQQQGGIRMDE